MSTHIRRGVALRTRTRSRDEPRVCLGRKIVSRSRVRSKQLVAVHGASPGTAVYECPLPCLESAPSWRKCSRGSQRSWCSPRLRRCSPRLRRHRHPHSRPILSRKTLVSKTKKTARRASAGSIQGTGAWVALQSFQSWARRATAPSTTTVSSHANSAVRRNKAARPFSWTAGAAPEAVATAVAAAQ